MSPRTMAAAYKIWAYCEQCGWNATATEIGDALGMTPARVARIVRMKGWSNRVRATDRSNAERLARYLSPFGSFVGAEASASLRVAYETLDLPRGGAADE